jgi:hypothetical protein
MPVIPLKVRQKVRWPEHWVDHYAPVVTVSNREAEKRKERQLAQGRKHHKDWYGRNSGKIRGHR